MDSQWMLVFDLHSSQVWNMPINLASRSLFQHTVKSANSLWSYAHNARMHVKTHKLHAVLSYIGKWHQSPLYMMWCLTGGSEFHGKLLIINSPLGLNISASLLSLIKCHIKWWNKHSALCIHSKFCSTSLCLTVCLQQVSITQDRPCIPLPYL
jgi:hypothetical protein